MPVEAGVLHGRKVVDLEEPGLELGVEQEVEAEELVAGAVGGHLRWVFKDQADFSGLTVFQLKSVRAGIN